jgi:hypothetical protein
MRAELISHQGRVIGRTRLSPGQTHVRVDHVKRGYGLQWRVVTFFGRVLAYGPIRTIQGDTVVIDLSHLHRPPDLEP